MLPSYYFRLYLSNVIMPLFISTISSTMFILEQFQFKSNVVVVGQISTEFTLRSAQAGYASNQHWAIQAKIPQYNSIWSIRQK